MVVEDLQEGLWATWEEPDQSLGLLYRDDGSAASGDGLGHLVAQRAQGDIGGPADSFDRLFRGDTDLHFHIAQSLSSRP
ncbi:hypothetical protein GCM10022221_07700 [Actinocorallia aurea]